MKLWLLSRDENKGNYDEYIGFVIRAESEQAAREIAVKKVRIYREPDTRWLNSEYAACTEITLDGDEGIILDSFNAG